MNPENEKLRNEIQKPPDVKDILEEILKKTNKIHVSFLYAEIGMRLLQKLALCLCSTKNSLVYSGWKELGIQLGLDPLLPKCLENCNIMNQDPVFMMLVSYTQKDEATVGKVYQGLYDIQRYDVITQTDTYVNEFYNEMCNRYDMSVQTEILKPKRIPRPPVIFQNLEIRNYDKIISRHEETTDEIKCTAVPVNTNNKKKYSKIVMLTYNSQDAIIAQKVANEFRKERNGQRIGVILLQEQADKVCAEREELVVKFFKMAHYIIPIVSFEYLSCVSKKEAYYSAIDNMDCAYVKYIYKLMSGEYTHDGCTNKKIRCIIPDDYFSKVYSHYFFINPVFRTWVQLSEIDSLANKILSNTI